MGIVLAGHTTVVAIVAPSMNSHDLRTGFIEALQLPNLKCKRYKKTRQKSWKQDWASDASALATRHSSYGELVGISGGSKE